MHSCHAAGSLSVLLMYGYADDRTLNIIRLTLSLHHWKPFEGQTCYDNVYPAWDIASTDKYLVECWRNGHALG